MPAIEFIGKSRKNSGFWGADTAQLINLYREPTGDSFMLKSVPGTVAFADTAQVFTRNMAEVDGSLYAVIGGGLYRFAQSGAFTRLGDVEDGDTVISSNNGKVTLAAGGTYYVWDGTTLHQPVDGVTQGAFVDVGSVAFIGQFTVMTERGGRRFQWSDAADPLTVDGLSFSTAEGDDDDIIRGEVVNGNLWLMKSGSTEIWYLSGDDAVFRRIAGGVMETGLLSHGLLTKLPSAVFFVGSDGIAYVGSGTQLQPVSIPAVERDIADGQPRRCLYYEDEGHKFAVIQFSDRPAWVYDLSTAEWHQRASGVLHEPWAVVSSAKCWGRWFVGSDLGRVYGLDRVNADAEGPMRRTAVSMNMRDEAHRIIDALVLNARTGWAGTLTDEPQVMLSLSKDGGHTWGEPKPRGLGKVGQYERRVIWRGLGQSRQWAARIDVTDPYDLPILTKMDVVVR